MTAKHKEKAELNCEMFTIEPAQWPNWLILCFKCHQPIQILVHVLAAPLSFQLPACGLAEQSQSRGTLLVGETWEKHLTLGFSLTPFWLLQPFGVEPPNTRPFSLLCSVSLLSNENKFVNCQ